MTGRISKRCPGDRTDGVDVIERFHMHREMAARLASRYATPSTRDDLQQVAEIGLLLASRRFDPDLGEFERFAAVTIVGELKKHLRSTGWALRVTRSVQERALAVSHATDRLTVELQRSPTVTEVARRCSLTDDEVVDALRAHSLRYTTSTERDVQTEANDVDQRLAVEGAVADLDTLSAHLIELRFGHGRSQRDIARLLGISQSQVQRRLTAVLERLRDPLRDVAG